MFVSPQEVLRKPFLGRLCGSRSVGAATGTARRQLMLLNLQLWEAPVRNFDWVSSAFGYR